MRALPAFLAFPVYLLSLAPWPRAVHAEPLQVVASIQPLASITEELGAGRVQVHALVPPGASPHAFSARPSDRRRVARAALLLRAGHGVDAWCARLLPGSEARVLNLATLPGSAAHAWLDPLFVRDAVAPALSAAMATADPAGRAAYALALSSFQRRLGVLDAEIRHSLAAAPSRTFVAFHAAWEPFALRYDLREIGSVEGSAGEELGPRSLAALLQRARAAGVHALLVAPQQDARLARTLAAEFGARIVQVDPLGDPRDPRRATYPALLRYNARAFLRALGDGP